VWKFYLLLIVATTKLFTEIVDIVVAIAQAIQHKAD